jgi:DUF4097 and DUF4098 domain-containing protein YvlB
VPTFDTPEPISATIEVAVGDVRITASDRPDTVVDVRPSDPGADIDVRAAEQTRVEYADGRLLVKAPNQRALGLFGKPGSIDVEILLPSGSHLRGTAEIAAFHGTGSLGECWIKTAAGDIRLERTGALDVSSASGAIVVGTVTGQARVSSGGAVRLSDIDGDAVVKNSNGDSRIGTVSGDLAVKAANGDILVGHAGANVAAATSNGDVRIGEVTRGTVSVKSANGELEVGIPVGTAAYLDLHTQFGNMHNRLDPADAPPDGEDTVSIRARASYGDIVIRRP